MPSGEDGAGEDGALVRLLGAAMTGMPRWLASAPAKFAELRPGASGAENAKHRSMRRLALAALLVSGCAWNRDTVRAVEVIGLFAIDVAIVELAGAPGPLCREAANDPPHTCPDGAPQPGR